jgi:hypothetical protein
VLWTPSCQPNNNKGTTAAANLDVAAKMWPRSVVVGARAGAGAVVGQRRLVAEAAAAAAGAGGADAPAATLPWNDYFKLRRQLTWG